jgi:hypothetical protein
MVEEINGNRVWERSSQRVERWSRSVEDKGRSSEVKQAFVVCVCMGEPLGTKEGATQVVNKEQTPTLSTLSLCFYNKGVDLPRESP